MMYSITNAAMLFSATFRKKVERLCRDVLTDPVRVVIGDVGEANTDITQFVQVVKDPKDKWAWLLKHIVEFTSGAFITHHHHLHVCIITRRHHSPSSLMHHHSSLLMHHHLSSLIIITYMYASSLIIIIHHH